jgi:hypothetical protein
MKMEAVCFSETSVPIYKSSGRHNPEDNHGYLYRRKNVKS